MNERLRNVLLNLGLVVASVVVFFVIAEGYFAVFNPQIYEEQGGGLHHFQYDELLGWANRPNSETIFAMAGDFKTHIKINSKGLRDREYDYDKPEGIKRIVVLGDSYTWGLGVEANERFTEVLDDELLKNIQVINMGVSGYGNDQELLLLKNEGLKYRPDLVLVAFCGNDPADNCNTHHSYYYKPMFILNDDKELVLTNVPVPKNKLSFFESLEVYLYFHSHTVHFFADRILAGQYKFTEDQFIDPMNNRPTSTQERYNLTAAILKEIDTVAKTNNAKTLMVSVSARTEITDFLVEFGKENNIPVLDLNIEFRKYAEKGEQLRLHEGHWNANGHKLAAELIYNKLIEEQLIPLGGEQQWENSER